MLTFLLYSTISTLNYLLVYNNGTQQVLLCLAGTIPVQYKGKCILFGLLLVVGWVLCWSLFDFVEFLSGTEVLIN